MSKRNGKKVKVEIGFFQLINNLGVAIINKGMLIPLLITFVILVAILKMSQEDVTKFMFHLVEIAHLHHILGYVFALFLLIGWIFHSRYQRNMFRMEIDRMADVKNKSTQKLTDHNFKSSKKG